MWHFIHFIVRPAEALLGLFFIITAVMLYPDEEGKIQSRLEDFWITVDDYRNKALSWHARFMQEIAKFESRILDKLFGPKLFSVKAVGVSLSFSILASCAALGVSADSLTLIPMLFALALLAMCIFVTRQWVITLVVLLPFLIIILILVLAHGEDFAFGVAALGAGLFMVIFVVGITGDFLFITVTRRLLRLAGQMTSSFRIAFIVLLNALLAVALVSPYLTKRLHEQFDKKYRYFEFVQATSIKDHLISAFGLLLNALDNDVSRCIAMTNLFDVAMASLFALLAIVLLIHLATWPILTRTLFRMTDIGTKGRRAILVAVGMALLSTSIFHDKIPDLFKELVKAFGG